MRPSLKTKESKAKQTINKAQKTFEPYKIHFQSYKGSRQLLAEQSVSYAGSLQDTASTSYHHAGRLSSDTTAFQSHMLLKVAPIKALGWSPFCSYLFQKVYTTNASTCLHATDSYNSTNFTFNLLLAALFYTLLPAKQPLNHFSRSLL